MRGHAAFVPEGPAAPSRSLKGQQRQANRRGPLPKQALYRSSLLIRLMIGCSSLSRIYRQSIAPGCFRLYTNDVNSFMECLHFPWQRQVLTILGLLLSLGICLPVSALAQNERYLELVRSGVDPASAATQARTEAILSDNFGPGDPIYDGMIASGQTAESIAAFRKNLQTNTAAQAAQYFSNQSQAVILGGPTGAADFQANPGAVYTIPDPNRPATPQAFAGSMVDPNANVGTWVTTAPPLPPSNGTDYSSGKDAAAKMGWVATPPGIAVNATPTPVQTPPIITPVQTPPIITPVQTPPIITPVQTPPIVNNSKGDYGWPIEGALWPVQQPGFTASGDSGTAIEFVADSKKYPLGILIHIVDQKSQPSEKEFTISLYAHDFTTSQPACRTVSGAVGTLVLRFGQGSVTALNGDCLLQPGLTYYLNVREWKDPSDSSPRGVISTQFWWNTRTDP